MLNGLADYIFGRRAGELSTGNDDTQATAGRIVNGKVVDDVVDEGDWILVDTEEKSGSRNGELELLALPSSTESSGSASPVTTVEALGWNITPPPCFIASQQPITQRLAGPVDKRRTNEDRGGASPTATSDDDDDDESSMEISVFENLLIEHPSMSVYRRRPVDTRSSNQLQHAPPPKSQGSTPVDVPVSQAKKEEAKPPTVVDISPPPPAPVTATVDVDRRPRVSYAAAAAAAVHLLDGANNGRAAVASQQRAECANKGKDLGANRMRRQNLCAYDTSLGKAGKQRKNRVKNSSGRSNDRKCQTRFI